LRLEDITSTVLFSSFRILNKTKGFTGMAVLCNRGWKALDDVIIKGRLARKEFATGRATDFVIFGHAIEL
jgi:hypothetical protein